METAISIIKLMPFSKQQVQIFASQLIETIENGEIDPLELAIYFKAFEKVQEQVKETLSKQALIEAEKHGKSFEFRGAKIDIKEVGTSYDFSKCGDYKWERLNTDLQTIKNQQKERETMIKTLKEPLIEVNQETGETFTIYPPIKKSTTGITISLK